MTGYVHEMVKNDLNFNQFVWCCARAFGALINMREAPTDAPIPEEVTPSSFYANALKDSQKEVKRLNKMTNEQKIRYGERKKKESISSLKKSIKEQEDTNKKINTMIDQVNEWQPKEEQKSLKDFILQQLKSSLEKTDHLQNELENKEKIDPLELFHLHLSIENNSVQYYEAQVAKEKRNLQETNQWLKNLRESVPYQGYKSNG